MPVDVKLWSPSFGPDLDSLGGQNLENLAEWHGIGTLANQCLGGVANDVLLGPLSGRVGAIGRANWSDIVRVHIKERMDLRRFRLEAVGR